MAEENISQEFILKKTDKTRNYFTEEMKQNELISKKPKMICKILNYIEHLLILASKVGGCVSISAFATLVGIPVGITSSAVGMKICAIITVIKKYKSIIQENEKAQ